jgi:hypothetical protein
MRAVDENRGLHETAGLGIAGPNPDLPLNPAFGASGRRF